MSHPLSTTRGRRWRPAAMLTFGVLLAWTIAGCSSGDDSASTTSSSAVTAESGDTGGDLATACREVDLAPIEQAATNFAASERSIASAAGESEQLAAFVALLDSGSVLFSTMASSLEDLFTELASAANQPSLSEVPDRFLRAADDFSRIATDINEAGEITPDDIASIDAVGGEFDELDQIIDDSSSGGQELRRVPACETFIRNFEAIGDRIDGGSAGGEDSGGDDGSGVNTDAPDGTCDQDRWLQDPDCGDGETINSDRADGTCDENRFFTDPDC